MRELSAQIHATVPNRPIETGARFSEFVASNDNQDIRAYSASARQFQIMEPVHLGNVGVGNNTFNRTYSIDVWFSYPESRKWNAAAADDLDKIERFLCTHPSAVSGVSARWITADHITLSEKSADDLRRYWRLQVFAQLEVTHTT